MFCVVMHAVSARILLVSRTLYHANVLVGLFFARKILGVGVVNVLAVCAF